MKVKKETLIKRLLQLKGAQFISVVYETTPRMRKTGNPYIGVKKTSKINGMVNFWYDKGVKKRRADEGKNDFYKKGESWHRPVLLNGKLTPLATHKKNENQYYLRMMYMSDKEVAKYELNGKQINKAKLDPYLYESSYENQGLDNPLIILTISVDNIKSLNIDNKQYIIV